jgi:branched-chain amino acid transport system substrate-binding protein
VGLAQFFREPFLAGGGQIVSEQKYTGGDKDFKAQLTAIKSTNPDAIIVPGYYTEAGLIVAQARQLGITVPLFGGDGWEAPELLEIAGPAALEGTYYSTHFSAKTGRWREVRRGLQGKYSGECPMRWPRWAMTR